MELGNFIERPGGGDTSRAAARALLAEIPGIPARREGLADRGGDFRRATGEEDWPDGNPQDWDRRFLTSGGAAYIDLDHLELCSAETTDALELVAGVQALFRLARRACAAANARLPSGWRIHVLANNSDGQGNSWGSHLNFLVARPTFDRIFHRRLHHLLWLATYQASSILFTGQGKVGAENGRPPVDFQLSQRADFFETPLGWQTTHRRPIVNARDEPLCGQGSQQERGGGDDPDFARLHSIFFDHTLCHGATYLKVGVMQIVLAMLEAGRVNLEVLLADPVQAVLDWSRDLTFQHGAETVSGRCLTALEIQEIFCVEAGQFIAEGHCDGVVPGARAILRYWEQTLRLLRAKDLDALAPRLDWVRKYLLLERAMTRAGGAWKAPAIKRLDQQWGDLDPASGLYWACERAGWQEILVPEEHVRRREHAPPEDSRAWTRSLLLLAAGPGEIESVDWDAIEFRLRTGFASDGVEYRWVSLANPLRHTRASWDGLEPGIRNLRDRLRVLGAVRGRVPRGQEGRSSGAWADPNGSEDSRLGRRRGGPEPEPGPAGPGSEPQGRGPRD